MFNRKINRMILYLWIWRFEECTLEIEMVYNNLQTKEIGVIKIQK